MFDQRLRVVKEAVLGPVTRPVARFVRPLVLSIAGVMLCVGAALAAWRGLLVPSVGLWLAGRLLDGLDGAVARQRGVASDLGAYVDTFLDTIGYAAVPLGVAASQHRAAVWAAAAVLLASFYLNTVSWMYLSALLEKRAQGASATGEMTSVTMPRGLVEGAETIVLFTWFLLRPTAAVPLFFAMSVAVLIGAGQRLAWACRGPLNRRSVDGSHIPPTLKEAP